MSDPQQKEPQGAAVIRHPRTAMAMGERGFDFTLDGAIRFAQGLIDSGMVPKGITGPGAVVGLIEAGKELGLAPMYALANLTFTNGRLGIMGDAAKALIRRSAALKPGTDFAEIYEGEEFTPAWKCTVTAHRDGQPEPFARSFSIADAITAKLVRLDSGKVLSRSREGYDERGPWSTYTKRMLMYRALGFLARDYFSDVIGGAVIAEELRDYPKQDDDGSSAPPPEPDPLLAAGATLAETFQAVEVGGATVIGTPRPDEAVIDADIVKEPQSGHAPPPATDGRAPIPLDEQKLAADIDKLEGKIITADTRARLNKVWDAAASLLARVDEATRKRLTKLYQQNAQNFNP
jgi:hypothetical protein